MLIVTNKHFALSWWRKMHMIAVKEPINMVLSILQSQCILRSRCKPQKPKSSCKIAHLSCKFFFLCYDRNRGLTVTYPGRLPLTYLSLIFCALVRVCSWAGAVCRLLNVFHLKSKQIRFDPKRTRVGGQINHNAFLHELIFLKDLKSL